MSHLPTGSHAKGAGFSALRLAVAALLSIALAIGFLAPVSSAHADDAAASSAASAQDEGQSLAPQSGEFEFNVTQSQPSYNLGDTAHFVLSVENPEALVDQSVLDEGKRPIVQYRLYSVDRVSNGTSTQVVSSSTFGFSESFASYDYPLAIPGTYQFSFTVLIKTPTGELNSYGQPMYRIWTPGTKEWTKTVEVTVASDTNYESPDQIVEKATVECKNKGCTTDYDKALWLHDWLIEHCSYESGYISTDEMLVVGKGNCEAYHGAYVRLLNKMGIETRRVDSSADNHVWTGAKLDGKWYNIDVGWDDNEDYASTPFDDRYLYFAVTSSTMKAVHTGWDGKYAVSQSERAVFDADSYDDNYFIKTGKIDPFTSAYEKSAGTYSVKSMLAQRSRQFSIPVENESWTPDHKNIIYPLVAYRLSKEAWGDGVLALSAAYNNNALQFNVKYVNDITVTFNANGGSFPATTIVGQAGVKWDGQWPSATPTRSNYTFVGWNAAANGSGKSYTADDFFPEQDVTLYAQWRAQQTSGGDASGGGQGSTTTNPDTSSNAPVTTPDSGSTPAPTPAPDPLAPPKSGSWTKTSGRWWYKYDDGSYAKSTTLRIGDAIYSFDGAGWMRTGWAKHSADWYYHASSGAAARGWVKSGGKWYYLDRSTCVMKIGFYADGGSNYYSNSSGAMLTGWIKVGGTWYLMSGSGAMRFGWVKQGGVWYYLAPGTGKMATGWFDVGSKRYYANSSGAMRTGWIKDGDQWFYLTSSGAMAENKWISGKYWVGANGVMATSEWVDNNRYYVDGNGAWVPNARR